jgi:hypothetical protein
VARPGIERGVLAATYLVLIALGVMTGVIESFLVPQRMLHGTEGLAVLLALVSNLSLGLLGGLGTRTIAGAVVPVVGWFVPVAALSLTGPGGDLVIPGDIPVDPGIATVTQAFLVVGILAGGIALVVTSRYTKRRNAPRSTV